MNTLNQLAGTLAGSFLPAATRQHNFFINDIPADLPLTQNHECLAHVISGMMAVVVSHTSNTCIRLTAEKHGYMIVLGMEQGNNTHMWNMELQQANYLPKK